MRRVIARVLWLLEMHRTDCPLCGAPSATLLHSAPLYGGFCPGRRPYPPGGHIESHKDDL